MARQRIRRQQNDIDQQHQRAHTHSELPVKVESLKHVFPQEKQEQHRQVQKISMDILENERKSRFALVVPIPFAYRTSRRVQEKRAIVGFAVVIAGSPEAQWPAQYQQCWRKLPPMMMLINQRRIEWREVRSPLVELSLERPQCRINPEPSQQ